MTVQHRFCIFVDYDHVCTCAIYTALGFFRHLVMRKVATEMHCALWANTIRPTLSMSYIYGGAIYARIS